MGSAADAVAGGPAERSLAGVRVAITRSQGRALATALHELGAEVVVVPVIEITPPADGGVALDAALRRLGDVDWIVVTSAHGARAVGAAVASAPTALRVGAVGPATAAVLAEVAGRPADLVPSTARADGLVAEFPPGPWRVLVAQADGAAPTLVAGLAAAGHTVEAVTAYRTVPRPLSPAERAVLATVDAVEFASGSAVEGWLDAGLAVPPVVVVIGPSTAAAAAALGVTPSALAAAPTAAAVAAALTTGRARVAASGEGDSGLVGPTP